VGLAPDCDNNPYVGKVLAYCESVRHSHVSTATSPTLKT
jgi:hypothetical protein